MIFLLTAFVMALVIISQGCYGGDFVVLDLIVNRDLRFYLNFGLIVTGDCAFLLKNISAVFFFEMSLISLATGDF